MMQYDNTSDISSDSEDTTIIKKVNKVILIYLILILILGIIIFSLYMFNIISIKDVLGFTIGVLVSMMIISIILYFEHPKVGLVYRSGLFIIFVVSTMCLGYLLSIIQTF